MEYEIFKQRQEAVLPEHTYQIVIKDEHGHSFVSLVSLFVQVKGQNSKGLWKVNIKFMKFFWSHLIKSTITFMTQIP